MVGGEGSPHEGEGDHIGTVAQSTAGIMLLFMTIALIHNANVLLKLCRGTQNLSRHKLIVRVPLVCDRHSGGKKRFVHHYQRVSNRLAYTPEHKSTCNYSYANTLTPILTLPTACRKLQPHSLLDWNRKTMVPKKAQKCGNAVMLLFGQACARP